MNKEYRLIHSTHNCYCGENLVAPKYSAAKERLRPFVDELCNEVKKQGLYLDKEGKYAELLKNWAAARSLTVEEVEERKGVWFVDNKNEKYVTLVAVGVK